MSVWSRLHSARRCGLAATGLALVVGVLPVVEGVVVPGTTAIARADDVTASQNLLRDGWDPKEPNLSPATVQSFSSAPRWTAPVDGSVYAQPLVLGSTVIVATESDWVYGLNAGTGVRIWATRLGSAYPIASDPTFAKQKPPCTDLVPNIGVTGTPAYDSTTGHIFMFANVVTNKAPAYYMVEMDPANGNIISKTLISGQPSNDPHITFSAKYNMERPGVLITDGAVIGAFASHCDTKPYSGYVARVDIATHMVTLWSDESDGTNDEGGIWQSGGGIMSDGPGRIFVTSGNGVSPTKRAGGSPGGQLAESVIRLAVNNDGTLSAQDFFSPANSPSLDASDTDLGSGGPVGVPFPVGSYTDPLAQIGKDGRIWLLNRDSLGGRRQGPGGSDDALFVSKAYGGMWGHPAIFGDTPVTIANSHTSPVDNDFLVSVGKDDVLRVFRFAVAATNKPRLTNVASSSLTYGYTSGSPVVTSNGDDPASAVIWEVYVHNSMGKTGSGSVLEAYSLGNVASAGKPSPCVSTHMCTLTNIWHSDTFTSAKFSIPATSQGWVYVGTRDGHVLGFAAPGAAAPAVAIAATLPPTAVGSTSSQSVSVTATKTVTITGASATTSASNSSTPTNEFAVGQVSETPPGTDTALPVTLPVTLTQGDKLSVQTSFTPTAPGGTSGSLSLSSNSSSAPAVTVPLTAEGTKEGIYAQPATQTFPLAPDQGVIPVPVGDQKQETVAISNLGTVTQTISLVTQPAAPFTATNVPALGTKLNPGASINLQVAFTPTSPGPASSSFTIGGSTGQDAVITLTGVGAAAVSQLTTSTAEVNFGRIRVGKKATAQIRISNTGNTESLVTAVTSLRTPFATQLKLAAGLPFNPGADLLLPVTFAPTRRGTFRTQLTVAWRDVNGDHTLIVMITGTAIRRHAPEDVARD